MSKYKNITRVKDGPESSDVFTWHCSRCDSTQKTTGPRQPACIKCLAPMSVLRVEKVERKA